MGKYTDLFFTTNKRVVDISSLNIYSGILFSKARWTEIGYYLKANGYFLKSRRMTSKIWSLNWLYFFSLLSVEVKASLSIQIARGWNHCRNLGHLLLVQIVLRFWKAHQFRWKILKIYPLDEASVFVITNCWRQINLN